MTQAHSSTSFAKFQDATNHNLPPICGYESEVQSATTSDRDPIFLNHTNLNLETITSGFACALHMHQPTIPAGTNDSLISHLQYMFDHPNEGDNHNAAPFAWCYSRMGEFIPQLVHEGCNPRIMLDYSGNLLWGFSQMQRHDILDNLKLITCDKQYQPYVEWLGTMWSHAVVPSTPIPDIKLHIQAWQHHFATIFGAEALKRVRGFSPPEMHLPNHPDTLYEYVKALKECGYQWLLVQEHSIETLDGQPLFHEQKYIPNQLIARNSSGHTISITALIKTQGSDTKLVAQMQPYFEAKTKGKQSLASYSIPSLVSQIADGENGGVMMNEYPRDLFRVYHEIRDNGGGLSGTVPMNGTEYLELVASYGIEPKDYPPCQAVQQHKIWEQLALEGDITPELVETAIAHLQQTDPNFHMDGASWTNSINWVKGYEDVLDPMLKLSTAFHQKYDSQISSDPYVTQQQEYKQALLYNLLLQTSCYRYWGAGRWTDYAQKIYQLGKSALEQS
ncbi:glycosyl hydrolase family 57 [Leptolyngbya sp. AN02str]|uniref:glycosyl hydrolase family 57 n=1 Tax=Leptolyngbya sp. AN02str TaxID=3423363 RepID=UPI003D314D55